MKCYIIVTDAYAGGFLQRLIQKCKNESKLKPEEYSILSSRGNGNLNREVNKYIYVALVNHDRVMILLDGDKKPRKEVEKEFKKRIKPKFQKYVKLLIFDTEIEEWILKGLGLNFSSSKKASRILDEFERAQHPPGHYLKRMLPSYVNKLNIGNLNSDINFKELLTDIEDP
jgi:hypothetical protein